MNRYIAQDYHDVYVDLVYIEDQFLSCFLSNFYLYIAKDIISPLPTKSVLYIFNKLSRKEEQYLWTCCTLKYKNSNHKWFILEW